MTIKLSDHFNYPKLIRFTMPSIAMILISSVYGMVDGFFVSNIIGETSFAAVNFIYPIVMFFPAFGFMIGAGGGALIAMLLGRKEKEHAIASFSTLIYFTIILGIVVAVIGELIIEPLSIILGAEDKLLHDAVTYGRIFLITTPAFMLQYSFQRFMSVAQKPNLGLVFAIGAGIANIVLDALFMIVFKWGVVGAAAATCIGQLIGGFGPVIYFLVPNNSLLRLGKPNWSIRDIKKAMSNGMGSFFANISLSVVNVAYNFQLLRLLGEYGVSAYGVCMYMCFISISIYQGFSLGVGPLISYQYGAGRPDEIRNLLKKSIVVITIVSIVANTLTIIFARPLCALYAGYDAEFLELSVMAFSIYMVNYYFAGYNVFAMHFFASLNNGRLAMIVSVLRILVFQIACVFILPAIFGPNGIWWAVTVGELLTFLISINLFKSNRKKYGY